jgi:hypothetical protein
MLRLRRIPRHPNRVRTSHVWAFMFGEAVLTIEDCATYFSNRDAAVAAGERFGVAVDNTGLCYEPERGNVRQLVDAVLKAEGKEPKL